MSEIPPWAKRELARIHCSEQKTPTLYRLLHVDEMPDPRGSRKPIWWRQWWPLNRRQS